MKKYISFLESNDMLEVRAPTPEQLLEHMAVKRYVWPTTKTDIFLRLYTQSRERDLVVWKDRAPVTTIQIQSHDAEHQEEELRKNTQSYKSSDGLKTPSS